MTDIRIPFDLNASGAVMPTQSYSDLWRQRVLSVLCTPRTSRVMRPNFGAEINAGVFENYSDAVSAIKGIVGNSFTEHLSALDLVKIETEIGTSDEIIVDIWYRLPNGQTDTTQLQANSNLYGFGA